MSFKIAIASGKGGTGKTTVSINLFHHLRKLPGVKVQLVDCDVEEPNDVLFFSDAIKVKEDDVFQLIPVIDKSKCTFCRKCVSYCEFNAIVIIPPVTFAEVNASLCHSCGACSVACTDDAIVEKPVSIGKIICYATRDGGTLIEGRIKIGSSMQTMLIRELKKRIPDPDEILIYDAPPGTSCPVVETISDADYIILVAEPTPFGLHDLMLMTELLNEIQRPFGVIVNKAGLGTNAVYSYLNDQGITLLGEIPFNEDYASCYATGNLFDSVPQDVTDSYYLIIERLEQKMPLHEGNNCLKW